MSSIAEEVMDNIKKHGGSFRSQGQVVDLLTVKRSMLSWVSKSIQKGLGVETKPKGGSTCPMCNKAQQYFELDHQGPWRVYVAATAGGHIKPGPNGELFIDRATLKALYNDPSNLWWICKDCNSAKSDKVYDTEQQLEAIRKHTVPDGIKGVDPSSVFK